MVRFVKAIPLLLVIILLAGIASVASAQSSECEAGSAVTDAADNPGLLADCDALLAARDTLQGDATLNWSADLAIDRWDGVRLSGSPQRVTSLRFYGQRLTGTIPAELGGLTNLEYLDLSDNYLTGPIPAELGGLANLQWRLDLSDNYLTGPIPAELGSLASLELLDLSDNYLTGPIPAELGSLASLELLDLSDNYLTGPIPAELGSLTDLHSLWLFGNQFSGPIPSWLGNLTNLSSLDLSGNQLSGPIPSWLGNLTNLSSLDLSGNQLSGPIPAELGSLTNLQWLFLSGNQLSGPIPSWLGSLTNLEDLGLADNQLSGTIPAELGSLTNLEWLGLADNQLSGPIPAELGSLANLRYLDLSGNQLTGCIPHGLRIVKGLDGLSLDFCPDPGTPTTTPPPLGDCATGGAVTDAAANPGLVADCTALLAARDTLAGTAALNWSADLAIDLWEGVGTTGTPPRVASLNFYDQRLTGEIPEQLGSLTYLKNLRLSDHLLSEPIPAALGSLIYLKDLGLADNRLSGTIPAELGGMTYLKSLYLYDNYLRGTIPAEMGNLTNLQRLYLAWNQLTGCVPAGLRDVPTNDFTALGLDFCEGEEPAPADPCLEVEALGALTAPVTKTGAWADDCDSEARPGSYARYYSFTLAEAGQVEINLTSSVDPYLVLRQGSGRDGVVEVENDNVGSRNFNSSINRMLAAGTYTVEATTYFAKQTGDFTLSVRPLQETEDLGPLTRSVDRSNSRWTSDHESTQQMGSYARYYTFTLYAATHMVINLTSPEDPYLFLLGSRGAVVHENDNVTTRNLNSRIDETLPAGTYTIEATTYFPGRTGTFHLSIGYFGATGG